jgi:hypothetical protein
MGHSHSAIILLSASATWFIPAPWSSSRCSQNELWGALVANHHRNSLRPFPTGSRVSSLVHAGPRRFTQVHAGSRRFTQVHAPSSPIDLWTGLQVGSSRFLGENLARPNYWDDTGLAPAEQRALSSTENQDTRFGSDTSGGDWYAPPYGGGTTTMLGVKLCASVGSARYLGDKGAPNRSALALHRVCERRPGWLTRITRAVER